MNDGQSPVHRRRRLGMLAAGCVSLLLLFVWVFPEPFLMRFALQAGQSRWASSLAKSDNPLIWHEIESTMARDDARAKRTALPAVLWFVEFNQEYQDDASKLVARVAMEGPDRDVRIAAVSVLGTLGTPTLEAQAALRLALQSADEEMQQTAISALHHLAVHQQYQTLATKLWEEVVRLSGPDVKTPTREQAQQLLRRIAMETRAVSDDAYKTIANSATQSRREPPRHARPSDENPGRHSDR